MLTLSIPVQLYTIKSISFGFSVIVSKYWTEEQTRRAILSIQIGLLCSLIYYTVFVQTLTYTTVFYKLIGVEPLYVHKKMFQLLKTLPKHSV